MTNPEPLPAAPPRPADTGGTDPTQTAHAQLSVEVAATGWNATLLRRRFSDWLGPHATHPVGEDLIFAVYEALANSAQHAYLAQPGLTGSMHLRAHQCADGLTVTITDHGRWRPTPHTPSPRRGLRLIRALVTRAHIERGGIELTDGTRVHLYSALPTHPQPLDTHPATTPTAHPDQTRGDPTGQFHAPPSGAHRSLWGSTTPPGP